MRAASIYQPSAIQKAKLFDKTITWGDQTTELVQIDTDGWFRLDGIRKKLVGFGTGSSVLAGTDYYTEACQAILHTELDYLMEQGVRLLEVHLPYEGLNLESRYEDTLQLCYEHKMLVIPVSSHKDWNQAEFDSLATIDFDLGEETVSQQMPKWFDAIAPFSNIVAIVLANEPDSIANESQLYTIKNFMDYMDLMVSLAKVETNLPLLVKTMPYPYSGWYGHMENEMLPYTAIPCANIYADVWTNFAAICSIYNTWYKNTPRFRTSSFWATEYSYRMKW